MIVEIDPRLAEKSEEFTQRGFNIKAGAKAFQILTSTLYSDKNLAVLRELVCNAYDAQKENNTLHLPSELHIPNYLEQWFRIRDYGKGIPHEFMMGEVVTLDHNGNAQKVGYTTAFHSTRDDSNDSIGGFGIGRLASLSISDSYTVISITKGEENKNTKRFYSVIMEGGLPNIVLMGESEIEYNESDKDTYTGFQVDVPVKNYSDFEQKAIKFLSNIDFKVNLKGTSNKIESREVVLERKTWRAFETGYNKHTYRSYDNTVFAKIGIVRYPINSSYLPDSLQNKGFEMDFPIGSLEVTPSRESLSYNEKTISFIKLRAEEVEKEIKEEFESKLAAAPTLWDARKLVNSLNSGELSRFYSMISTCHYNNKVIYSSIKVPQYLVYKFYMRNSYRRASNKEFLTNHTVSEVTARDNVVFVINEALTLDAAGNPSVKILHSNKRIKKYLEENPNTDFYVFSQATYDKIKNDGDLDGAPDPLYLSKLPFDPVTRVKGVKGGNKKSFDPGEIYYVDYDVSRSYPRRWLDNSTLPKEGYYVIAGKNERSSQLDGYNNQYSRKINFCKALKIPVDYVFAIHPRKEKSFLKQYPDWKPAAELDEKIKKELDIHLNGVIVEDVTGVPWEFAVTLANTKEFQQNKQIARIKELINDYEAKKYTDLMNIAAFYNVKVIRSKNIYGSYIQLIRECPLLNLAGGQSYKISEYKKEWAKYLGS